MAPFCGTDIKSRRSKLVAGANGYLREFLCYNLPDNDCISTDDGDGALSGVGSSYNAHFEAKIYSDESSFAQSDRHEPCRQIRSQGRQLSIKSYTVNSRFVMFLVSSVCL